jgi:methylphosphotriester-DNA--protein-cysteine methyltransferase
VNSGYGTAPAGAVYIGNTNNQKLHKASCSGLPQSQNQVLFDTLEAATAAGYTADLQCKLCKPYGEIEASASTSASVTKEASTAVTESTTSSVSTGSYIGNTNNQKLHKASCNSLPKPQNQVLFSSLDEAQAAGYTKDNQCKRCYPYGK